MTILRRRLSSGFAVLPTATLEDARLSFRARGILAFLIAKPDDWEARTEAIARAGKEGRDAVRKAVQELKVTGYYRVVDERREDGTLRCYTEVFDEAQEWVAEEYRAKEALRIARKTARQMEEEKENEATGDGISGVGEPVPGEPVVGESGMITKTQTKIPPTPAADTAGETAAADAETSQPDSKDDEPPVTTGATAAEGSMCRTHLDGPGRSCRACGTSPRARAQQEKQAEKERRRTREREADAQLLAEVQRDGAMSESMRETWARSRALVTQQRLEGRGNSSDSKAAVRPRAHKYVPACEPVDLPTFAGDTKILLEREGDETPSTLHDVTLSQADDAASLPDTPPGSAIAT
ncbi:hypothetical protein ABZ419_03130 [Streptomyces cinnamoneus]|uniref:hypothetical protein n=1 Tax=Streptomyces cinnamoneus TaxID=53446 RepID=UPI0033C337B9